MFISWCVSGGISSLPTVSVQIVMDASGSMNGKLADRASKISIARSAIQKMVSTLPDSYTLSLRAYGHQSRPSAKNCQDTEMLDAEKALSIILADRWICLTWRDTEGRETPPRSSAGKGLATLCCGTSRPRNVKGRVT
jgi:hypothetical protein